MRKCTLPTSVFGKYPEHEIGYELKVESEWLYEPLGHQDWISADVNNGQAVEKGRKGLSIE